MKQNEVYLSPEIETIDFAYEGVLCGSNELHDESEGEW